MMQVLIQVLIFLITVLVLVTIHEFGHFWVAKRLGIRVLRFSIGFGKPLWKRIGKDGTEYMIAMLPLGGYVKLLDEREGFVPEAERHRAFNRKPLLSRFAVVLAGPAINMLFAILAFWIILMIGVQQVIPIIGEVKPHSIAAQSGLKPGMEIVGIDQHNVNSWQKIMLQLVSRLGEHTNLHVTAKQNQTASTMQTYNLNLATWKVDGLNPDPLASLGILPYQPHIAPVFNKVLPEGPAAQAGLKAGDKVLSLDGKPVSDWIKFVSYVRDHPKQLMRLTIQRGQQELAIKVVTGAQVQGLKAIGYLGVESLPVSWPANMQVHLQYSPIEALGIASKDVWTLTKFNFIVLGKMLVGKVSLQSIGGPISIYRTAGIAFEQGLIAFIAFLGLISLMLAFVNILPIPGLDGGHLLLFCIEAVIRRPLSVSVQLLIFRLGIIFLIVILLQATINDIMRLF